MRKITTTLLAGLLSLPLMATTYAAYPEKPIRMLVGFPAGGSADIVARMVTEAVNKQSGFEFVIENRTGAGGNLAFEGTAKATPDGYTLLFSTPGVAINPSLYRKVDFATADFTPVTLVGEAPLMIMVRNELPVKSIQELITASKKAPDAIRFASSGNGSSSHLAAEVFRTMSGAQYLHVPYRGGGPAITDLIGNRVDMTVLPIAESMPYIKDGKLRGLGQTGSSRSAIAPDIPTVAEAGVKDYAVATWYMVLGPKGLPDDIVDTLHKAFSKAVASDDLKKRLEERGVNVINANPTETAAFLQEQAKNWAEAIAASGTKLE